MFRRPRTYRRAHTHALTRDREGDCHGVFWGTIQTLATKENYEKLNATAEIKTGYFRYMYITRP
jgi:hypothetical protein